MTNKKKDPRTIKLSQNAHAIVDAEDYEVLSKFSWYTQRIKTSMSGLSYAVRHKRKDEYGTKSRIYMHRQIMGAESDQFIDHINGNGLDNRKENLRLCTRSENMRNRYYHRKGKLPGAYFHRETGKYQATITINKKNKYIGLFETAKEAHEAFINYKKAV